MPIQKFRSIEEMKATPPIGRGLPREQRIDVSATSKAAEEAGPEAQRAEKMPAQREGSESASDRNPG